MKRYNLYIVLIFTLLFFCSNHSYSQNRKPKNLPFADQKLFHLGFTVGINAQDLILSHTGFANNDKSVWYSEIPSYSVGFSVGFIADRYINQYMNLRVVPTLHFGEKRFTFREENGLKDNFEASIKTNYLSLPVHMRFSSERFNNIRPYVLAGGFVNTQIGNPKAPVIKLENLDYGIDIGLGCNLYFPLFKLSPELRFSFGLRDLIVKDRPDITDPDMQVFTNALKSGKSRMITLTFNFE
ncbi:PorT family protein [Dysgonomonas capnocytophagoides]|uniref:PorT family protein n=1 Tax=Dysgonomonas capnocytophagoides TaxID=45254 RepID=A0A4Y8L8B3_9BACT|nr:porin family protein [Dysgonomonas capnocytophagoides]TFD98859.1 PorT family protein [Dysgonomonas capnocytophagoides]